MSKDKAHECVTLLRRKGIDCVIAGGAARDLHHGRVPKDWDIVLLDDTGAEYAQERLSSDPRFDLVGMYGDGEYFGEVGEVDDSRLDWVAKFQFGGLDFDLLQYLHAPSTPQEAVDEFDCNLNRCWLGYDGNVVLSADYPAPGSMIVVDGQINNRAVRIPYLAAKFPEYQWPTINPEGN